MKTSCLLLLLLPLVLAQVRVYPEGVFVSHEGGRAEFQCLSFPIDVGQVTSVQWLVNGSLFEGFGFENADATFDENLANGVGRLVFENLTLNFNETSILCVAHFFGDRPPVTSTKATILILQGILEAVTNLMYMTFDEDLLQFTWTPPFTQDVAGTEPDVTYCVKVVDSINSTTLQSECDIIAPRFNYTVPDGTACYITLFTVTSVNRAKQHGGMSTVSYIEGSMRSNFESSVRTSAVGQVFNYTFSMDAPVCYADLTFQDSVTGERIELRDADLIKEGASIIFTTQQLRENREYSVIVRTTNIHGPATSSTRIRTYGVKDVIIAPTENTERNEIKVNVSYSDLANEAGALIMLISGGVYPQQTADFTRSAILPLDRNSSGNYTLPFQLYPGQHRVLVVDIEEDGTLQSGVTYPAFDGSIPVGANSQGFSSESSASSCDINNSSARLIVSQCIFNDSSMIGFQMIAQLDSSDGLNKLYISVVVYGEDTARLEVEESGVYQVTILPVRPAVGVASSAVEVAREVIVSDVLAITTEGAVSTSEATGASEKTAPTTKLPTLKDVPTTAPVAEGGEGSVAYIATAALAGVVLIICLIPVILLVICCSRRRINCTKKSVTLEAGESDSRGSNTRPESYQMRDPAASSIGIPAESPPVADSPSPVLERDPVETDRLWPGSSDGKRGRTYPRRNRPAEYAADLPPLEDEASFNEEDDSMQPTSDVRAAAREGVSDEAVTADEESVGVNMDLNEVEEQEGQVENDVPKLLLQSDDDMSVSSYTPSSPVGVSSTEPVEGSHMIPNRSHQSLVAYGKSHTVKKVSFEKTEDDESAADQDTSEEQMRPVEVTDSGPASQVVIPTASIISSAVYQTGTQSTPQGNELTDDLISGIVDTMPRLELLAPKLDLSSDHVNYIKTQFKDDLKRQKFEAVQKWKHQQGDNATLKNLIDIIKSIKESDEDTNTTTEAISEEDSLQDNEDTAIFQGLNVIGRRRSSTQLSETMNVDTAYQPSNVVTEKHIKGRGKLQLPRTAFLRSHSEPNPHDASPLIEVTEEQLQEFVTQVSASVGGGDILFEVGGKANDEEEDSDNGNSSHP